MNYEFFPKQRSRCFRFEPRQVNYFTVNTQEATGVGHFILQNEISFPLAGSNLNDRTAGHQYHTSKLHHYKESSHLLKRLQKSILIQSTCNLFSMTPLRLLKCRRFRYFVITTVFYRLLMIPGLVSKTSPDYKRQAI